MKVFLSLSALVFSFSAFGSSDELMEMLIEKAKPCVDQELDNVARADLYNILLTEEESFARLATAGGTMKVTKLYSEEIAPPYHLLQFEVSPTQITEGTPSGSSLKSTSHVRSYLVISVNSKEPGCKTVKAWVE